MSYKTKPDDCGMGDTAVITTIFEEKRDPAPPKSSGLTESKKARVKHSRFHEDNTLGADGFGPHR